MTNIDINNKNMFDKRVCLIINQLTIVKNLIINLDLEKSNLIKKLQQSYDVNDRTIYFNNLGIIINLIEFYQSQATFLESKYLEYLSIFSKNNDNLKQNLINQWEKEIDLFFSNNLTLNFQAKEYNCNEYYNETDETLEDYLCNTSKKLIKSN